MQVGDALVVREFLADGTCRVHMMISYYFQAGAMPLARVAALKASVLPRTSSRNVV